MRKRILLVFCLLGIVFSVQAQQPRRITILHTNDFHSHLQGFAPESAYTPDTIDGDPTVGGLARIATIISGVRNHNPQSTIVVDGGDCLMGTLFHTMERESGFQLPLMKKAGYDLVAVGNHDFDLGPSAYADIVTKSASRGEIPVMLLGNAVTDSENPADDRLEEAMEKGLIKPYYIIEKFGMKIGFFSLLGKDADESAPYAPPVTFSKIIKSGKKLVRQLRKEGCEVIICLSHCGIVKDKKGNWSGEDVKLAKRVRGIDLIISGHTHTLLTKPLIVRGVPIVQAGAAGRNIGRADLFISQGKVTLEDYRMIDVDDNTPGDMTIQEDIIAQKKVIDETVLKPLGMEYSQPVIETSFPLVCDEYGDVGGSNLGALVADAVYYYMNTEGPGTDIAMVAAGVVRDPLFPGVQSVADLFRTMSLGSGNDNIPGYPLSRLWVTGCELKSIAEILIMSSKSTPSHFCFYSHLKLEYDPKGGIFKKVKKIELTDMNGEVITVNTSKDDKKLYSIVANSYMLDFVGIIKKQSFGLINVVPKDLEGNTVTEMDDAVVDFNPDMPGIQEGKEWIALVKYLQQFGTGEGSSVPVLPEYYKEPQRSLVEIRPVK